MLLRTNILVYAEEHQGLFNSCSTFIIFPVRISL